MSAVDFPPLSNLSAKFRPELRVEEDWPVTRLACDIFYGHRVISAYFLRTLCPRNAGPDRSDRKLTDPFFLRISTWKCPDVKLKSDNNKIGKMKLPIAVTANVTDERLECRGIPMRQRKLVSATDANVMHSFKLLRAYPIIYSVLIQIFEDIRRARVHDIILRDIASKPIART